MQPSCADCDFGALVTFHTIPRSCPIPRNVVSFIGGNIGPRPGYLLWLNGREIMIETSAPLYEADHDPTDEFYQYNSLIEAQRNFGYYLEVIQSLLTSVDFGKTNWAYLLKAGDGGYYIKQKQKSLRPVSCPLWAQHIYEDEIEFTVWGQSWDRRGIWEDKEVDIFYAWSDDDMWRLNQSMQAYRFLKGMNLTFEIYGHLLRPDGTVIGLVTEAANGRMVRISDRTSIYDAIARIQSRNALYIGCGTNRFMVSPEGNVRLLELSCLRLYESERLHELERDAEIWHWQELDELFCEFETYGPYGNFRMPPDRFTTSHQTLKFIAPPPTIDRPLGGLYLPTRFFSACRIRPWAGYQEIIGVQRVVAEIYSIHQRRRIPTLPESSGSEVYTEDPSDQPVTRRSLQAISRFHCTHNHLRLPFYPFVAIQSRRYPITSRWSEDTESTS